jgi:hypothetical protein
MRLTQNGYQPKLENKTIVNGQNLYVPVPPRGGSGEIRLKK